MEGVAVDGKSKRVYIAMSYVEKGMAKEEGAPADHIQLPKVKAGATYAIDVRGGQKDQQGKAIASEWVGVSMYVPKGLLGEDIAVDALGNTAAVDKVANPDNVFFSSVTHATDCAWTGCSPNTSAASTADRSPSRRRISQMSSTLPM